LLSNGAVAIIKERVTTRIVARSCGNCAKRLSNSKRATLNRQIEIDA